MKATLQSRQEITESLRVLQDAATELAVLKSHLAFIKEEVRWQRVENWLLDHLADVQDRADIIMRVDLETYEQAMRVCFHEFSGSPNELSGSPNELSGSPNELSGSPKELSGSPKELSGSPKELSGSSKELSGSSKQLSGSPKELSGSPKQLSGSPNELSGSPKQLSGLPKELSVSCGEVTVSFNLPPGPTWKRACWAIKQRRKNKWWGGPAKSFRAVRGQPAWAGRAQIETFHRRAG